MSDNGERVIGVPAAGASAEAQVPFRTEPPEYVIYVHEGTPLIYQLFHEEDDD